MINKRLSNFIAFAAVLSALTQCSFDPQLEDLKARVVVQDDTDNFQKEGRPGGTLADKDCCKLTFNSPQELSGKVAGPTLVRRDNGTYVVLEPSVSLPINKEIQFYLDCASLNSIVRDPRPPVPDAVCTGLNNYTNFCRGKFALKGQNQVSIRVIPPEFGSGPGSCTADN